MARREEYDKQRFLKAKMVITIMAVAAAVALAIVGIVAGYGVAQSLLLGALMLLWIPVFDLYKWWYRKRP